MQVFVAEGDAKMVLASAGDQASTAMESSSGSGVADSGVSRWRCRRCGLAGQGAAHATADNCSASGSFPEAAMVVCPWFLVADSIDPQEKRPTVIPAMTNQRPRFTPGMRFAPIL